MKSFHDPGHDPLFVQRVMARIAEYEEVRQSRRRFWLGWCPPALALLVLFLAAAVPSKEAPVRLQQAALAWLTTDEPAEADYDTLALLAVE